MPTAPPPCKKWAPSKPTPSQWHHPRPLSRRVPPVEIPSPRQNPRRPPTQIPLRRTMLWNAPVRPLRYSTTPISAPKDQPSSPASSSMNWRKLFPISDPTSNPDAPSQSGNVSICESSARFVGQALRLPSLINVAGGAPALQCRNTQIDAPLNISTYSLCYAKNLACHEESPDEK